jgi:AmmeMemoRadiSam system protein B
MTVDVRPAELAGRWYPGDPAACRAFLDETGPPDTDVPPVLEGSLLGGLAPHAGWMFSGAIAATLYRALSRDRPDRTIVVLGAVHRARLRRAAVADHRAWETPLGELPVDAELAAEIGALDPDLVTTDREAHGAGENSIELQTGLLRGLLPDARFVPVLVPPSAAAVPFGAALGRLLAARDRPAAVVASTDLTHYGYGGWAPAGVGEQAVRWVKDVNDRRFLDLVVGLRADEILAEADAHRNACGAGATAAAVRAVREMGAREGVLLAQTTSHDVDPSGGADRFVGYAAVVFR